MAPTHAPPLAAAATDAGLHREFNEGATGLFPHLGLFAVAGGLGARGAGAVMSALALAALREHLEATRPSASRLAEAMRFAHQRLVERARSDRGLHGASSTLAVLLLGPEGIQVGHVGDSRVYRVAGGRIEQLTRDHTLLGEASRLLPGTGPETLEQLPRISAVLTRSLGMESLGGKEGEELDFEVQSFPFHPGELYLLCTWGLHAFVPTDELLAPLRTAPELETAAHALVTRARQRKATSNITCLLVRPEAQ